MAPVVTLEQRRFDEGLTPEGLGVICGVAGKTIRRLEESGARPTPAIAKRIADHFGVKPSDIWPVEKAAV